MWEKIKRIELVKKKVFVVGVVFGITLLIGGSLVLSESAFPNWIKILEGKKVIDIKKMEKEFNRLLKEGKVGVVKEIKEETPVVEPQKCEDPKECEEKARMAAAWGICGTLLGRLDPNEDPFEICKPYNEADGLAAKGKNDEAKALLEKGIARFPESRHLHKQLAHVLWYSYNDKGKDPDILEQAIKEAERALNIGMSFGQVDYHLTGLLSTLLGESKDVKTLDRIFDRVFAADSNVVVYEDYASALSAMNDSRTEEAFKEVMELKGGFPSMEYVEWLLDQGRESEVLLLPVEFSLRDRMAFYRGVALERLGRLDEARAEYAKFKEYNRNAEGEDTSLPMPKRFQIPGSRLQKEMKIRFEGDESSMKIQATTAISDEQAIKGLSYLIYGEARGETPGGMRAVGWIVRSRVLRGSIGPSSCRLGVNNTGSTLADQYKSVMCQGMPDKPQFNGMCKQWCDNPNTTNCSSTSWTTQVAEKVYNGKAPDPVSPHCPGGITNWGGSYCADSTECKGYKDTYKLAGPVLNYGTSGSCPSPHPGLGCGPSSVGKTCGNGGSDNCFYPYPTYCVGSGCVTYYGSFSRQGQWLYSSYFYSSVTGYHKGHLEGPEGNYNLIDFDLYLLKWINGSWYYVAASTRYGSVDDINYYGTSGYYAWGFYSYSGSGNFKHYTSRPQ